MASVYTHLWFDTEAEQAIDFYLSVFKDAKRGSAQSYTDTVPGTGNKQPLATFECELEGHKIIALNAGPTAPFNERASLYVSTRDQAETDYYWNALTADGGSEQPCGWLKDKFGVFWQVIPEILVRRTSDPDRQAADRALQAMYQMKKIVIADIETAFAGK